MQDLSIGSAIRLQVGSTWSVLLIPAVMQRNRRRYGLSRNFHAFAKQLMAQRRRLSCLSIKPASPPTKRLHVESLRISIECKAPLSALNIANPLSASSLATYMRRTYWVRFPLWGRLAVGNRQQPTNATAEAGFKILKHDERALPHKPDSPLRLDEYISARIPTREAQCRLFLTHVKLNHHKSRKRESNSEASLTAVETWQKPPMLPLSSEQQRVLESLEEVVRWRRSLPSGGSLADFCAEVTASADSDDSTSLSLSESWLSKIINRKAWPNEHVARAIAVWLAAQRARMPGACCR